MSDARCMANHVTPFISYNLVYNDKTEFSAISSNVLRSGVAQLLSVMERAIA